MLVLFNMYRRSLKCTKQESVKTNGTKKLAGKIQVKEESISKLLAYDEGKDITAGTISQNCLVKSREIRFCGSEDTGSVCGGTYPFR